MPHHIEYSALDLVAGKKVAHLHRARPLPLQRPVGDADGRRVVDVDGRRRLRVAELLEGELKNSALLDVEEEGAKLGLRRAQRDEFEDGAEDMDGAIQADGLAVAGEPAKEKIPPGPALRPGLRKVGGVRVDVEDHVAATNRTVASGFVAR